jgi:outer membrane protein assembly factor BamB
MLVACGGGGGDAESPSQPSTAGNPPATPPQAPPPPPPSSPPPSSPPQATTELEPAWQTTQGNASHTGYVPINLGRAQPVVAWEWPEAAEGTSPPAINPVVTGSGLVYVATESYYCAATLYALDGLSGAVRWSREFSDACSLNPPAVDGDQVYVTTTADQGTDLWALRIDDGEQVFRSSFDNGWYEVLAPTVYGDAIYTTGGQGGGVYAFDRGGEQLWSGRTGDATPDMYTPAVNEAHVYHYSGTSLEIWERTTGRFLGSILDTPASGNFASYQGAPVIGGHGNLIVHSRSGDGDGRVLSSFNVESRLREWTTTREYGTGPAVANGVVYAGRDAGMTVDAIDEATGEVLWSWSPATTQGDSGFRHNIIVTDDVLLVSTDVAVHAVDLATRQSLWRYDRPGRLALSGRFLFIMTGADTSDGRLVALDLAAPEAKAQARGQISTAASHRGELDPGAGFAPGSGSGSALEVIGRAAIAARVNASAGTR